MAHPLLHDLGLIELEDTLKRLTDKQHIIETVSAGPSAAKATQDENALFERFVSKLNRPGGPKISSRAIV